MRKLLAWLGIATLFVLTSTAHANNDVLKPYVVLILDTSGSMVCTSDSATCGNPTGYGPPSCGGVDNKLNHAKCAINNIVNSYGDMVFALGRFRSTMGGTTTPGTFPSGCCEAGPGINGQNGCAAGPTCNSTNSASGVMLQLLTALVDGNNTASASFTNFTANSCTTAGTDPEIWDAPGACVGGNGFDNTCGGATPLDGVLRGTKLYWQGNQATDSNNTVLWPSNLEGYDPINRDPSNSVFLPKAGQTTCNPNPTTCTQGAACTGANCCCVTQCRPYVTILLTDGAESCSGDPLVGAANLLTTTPRSDQINISTITRSGGVVTLTTAAAHAFKVGDVIIVSGVTSNTFNNGGANPATWTVSAVPSTTQIVYTQGSGSNTTSSGGNVRHASSTFSYRVETKVIGFGIAPGDPNIEAIAHAGGAQDLASVNEGYYANDESDIELAISQILADSVRSESCNDRDDDCDVRVDEDFPNKGNTCTNGKFGECAANGVLVCKADGTGLVCNAPDVAPGSEGTTCDSRDNDCDGLVDEGLGCTSCVPIGETCNNRDDDCDTRVDEGLTRACGQGTCTGVETCTAGTWGGCTAQPVSAEICNGRDDDCDGVCDGMQTGCSEVNGTCNPNNPTSCPQTDSPGDPGHWTMPDAPETNCTDALDNDLDGLVNDGCAANGAAETACNDAMDNDGDGAVNDGCPVPALPIAQNICRPGTRTCPQLCDTNGNSYGLCSGEVKPLATDPCNGLDDDCDNKIDEGYVPQDCSTNCGVGQTSCVNGQVTCNSTPAMDDDTCNNNDDDCDGMIDEDWICANPVNGMCPCGQGMVCDGLEKCINGQVVCQGSPLSVETCNCNDEDCDTRIDEGTVCPTGSTCTNCQCAFPCAQSEFPCPLGKKCDAGFCVNDPCYMHPCPTPPNGHAQTCIPKPGFPNEPQCVDACDTVTCTSPLICYQPTGECKPDNCTTFPERCTGDEVCVNGECKSNPCDTVTCPSNQYCLGGTCVGSCADITCPTGQRCRQGVCETDPCEHPCPFGYACHDESGECIEDPCKFRNCPQGQWCNPNDGLCEDDPCVANEIECPNEGEICRGGTCLDPDDLLPDAAGAAHVTVGGGGGCSTTGGGASGLVVGLAMLLATRRRRAARGGAQ